MNERVRTAIVDVDLIVTGREEVETCGQDSVFSDVRDVRCFHAVS